MLSTIVVCVRDDADLFDWRIANSYVCGAGRSLNSDTAYFPKGKTDLYSIWYGLMDQGTCLSMQIQQKLAMKFFQVVLTLPPRMVSHYSRFKLLSSSLSE